MAWFSCDILSQQILNMQTIGTASGSVASFSTDVTENLINCNCQFAASQAAGTPTPSAPIPIQAVNSIAVTRAGKNLFNDAIYTEANWTLQENGYYNGNAHALLRNSRYSYENGGIKTSGVVTVSFDISMASGSMQIYCLYEGDNSWTNLSGNVRSEGHKTFTTNSNKNCIAIGLWTTVGQTSQAFSLKNFQVEVAPSETAYEAYNGVTKTLNLGGDYYGGSVDKDGNIDANKDKIVIDGSQTITVATQSYIKSDACDGFITVNDIYPRVSPTNQQNGFAMCDKLSPVKQMMWNLTGYPNCMTINQNQIHLNIANNLLGVTDYTQETTATVKAKIKSFLESNPITVIFSKAPATAQASNAIELNTLLGVNNIYCDTGNTSVTYLETIKNHYNL